MIQTIANTLETLQKGKLDISYEENTEIATIDNTETPVAQIGETTYPTLESAIAAVPDNNTQTTVKLLRTIPLIEGITIGENKNVVLDMQYYDIKCFATDKAIENNGTLEIKGVDTSEAISITSGAEHGNNFELQDGRLVSTNHNNNTIAHTYIAIDLTERLGAVTVSVDAKISSEYSDYGYAIITDNPELPESTTASFIKISNQNTTGTYTSGCLRGGKIYYLHFMYVKDGSINKYDDTFTINSVKVDSIDPRIKSYSNTAIINNSELNIKKIKIDTDNVCGITNQGEAELVLSGTEITSTTRKCEKLLNNIRILLLTGSSSWLRR